MAEMIAAALGAAAVYEIYGQNHRLRHNDPTPPRPRQFINTRQTQEHRAWNDAVDAKRAAKKSRKVQL